MSAARFRIRLPRRAVTAMAAALLATAAQAQFAMAPSPLPPTPRVSDAEREADYRTHAARHLYAAYPMRVFKGRLPPMLYGVAVIEVDVETDGSVVEVRVRRPPAAPEVMPWIEQMVRRAAPFPAPARLGRVTYTDIWLVHKGGNFQLDALTEGQD